MSSIVVGPRDDGGSLLFAAINVSVLTFASLRKIFSSCPFASIRVHSRFFFVARRAVGPAEADPFVVDFVPSCLCVSLDVLPHPFNVVSGYLCRTLRFCLSSRSLPWPGSDRSLHSLPGKNDFHRIVPIYITGSVHGAGSVRSNERCRKRIRSQRRQSAAKFDPCTGLCPRRILRRNSRFRVYSGNR